VLPKLAKPFHGKISNTYDFLILSLVFDLLLQQFNSFADASHPEIESQNRYMNMMYSIFGRTFI